MKKPLIINVLLLVLSFVFLVSNSAAAREKLFTDKFEALKVDPKEFVLIAIYTFGSDEKEEVPYLLKFIADEDKNIRFNAIMMLGKYILDYESKEQLKKLYWQEQDLDVKLLILSSLETLIVDLDESKQFFEAVIATETDGKEKEFAQATLSRLEQYKEVINRYFTKKEINSTKFQAEYKTLYDSYGKEGQYEKLFIYSDQKDESDLRRLKERILERESDEVLYDYEEINAIIAMNRYADYNDSL
jgi:hypothetical protein